MGKAALACKACFLHLSEPHQKQHKGQNKQAKCFCQKKRIGYVSVPPPPGKLSLHKVRKASKEDRSYQGHLHWPRNLQLLRSDDNKKDRSRRHDCRHRTLQKFTNLHGGLAFELSRDQRWYGRPVKCMITSGAPRGPRGPPLERCVSRLSSGHGQSSSS
jgi:hypothetical protein